MLRIELLGPLRVVDGEGSDLTPPGGRERLCLATLAVVAPANLSTARLATELYRERPTRDPRNAVQAVVSRLRRALGQQAGVIETTASGYRLVDVELDVDRVEALLADAVAEPDPASAQARLDEAAGLWRGPILDGAGRGELLDAEQLRLADLRAEATELVAERWLAAGGHPQLVSTLEAAVRDEPLRERRWELLMLALYREGRQAEALRAYQRARSLLAEHLGLEPGPALAGLEQRILAHDPALDLAAAPAPASTGGPAASSTAPLPSGTVSLVLCDVEGSVRRWEQAPDETAAGIDELHNSWERAVEAAGGRLVKSTGDGVLAAFPTAAGAINAAIAAGGDQGSGSSLLVKAAIHTGSMAPVGGDYRGPVVNRCARLLELAHGGQILVSGTAAELARPDLAPAVGLRDLGLQWLRDVAEPMAVLQVDGPGVRQVFPPLRSRGPASLPRLRGPLLGRDELVSEVVELLGAEALVTLLGPGGIGKTSVALSAAWTVAAGRPVTFVDLAGVTEPGVVAHRVADVLVPSEHDSEQDPTERLADRLRVSTDLVVIDNAEHLLEAVAATLDRVLEHELKGSFLVTSRQPLGLAGEAIVGVPPLALPESDADLDSTGRSPSVQLFLGRVRSDGGDGGLSTGLLPVVAHICRRLDGIPLAIELAASRAAMLSIDDIAARLDDQLRLLRQVQSRRERRHRSLEGVVGWSVEQLSPTGRELFERLSVMAGDFGLDGVERFLDHCGLTSIDPLDGLEELCEASLLGVESGGSRFRVLEPIRQVAGADLEARGLTRETRRAHARWLIDLVTDANRRRDASRAEAHAAIDAEGDQLRAAVAWIGEAGEVDLATAIAFPSSWWFLTRDARAGDRLLVRLLQLLDRESDPVGWASVVLAVGVATAAHPRSTWPDETLAAAMIYDEHGHHDACLARVVAAFAQAVKLDNPVPLRLVAEARAMVPPGDRWISAVVDMASMVMQSVLLSVDTGSAEAATVIAAGERAAAEFREMGEEWALGVTLGELGRVHQLVGDHAAAEACYQESLGRLKSTDYHGTHYLYGQLGRLMSARGDHQQAASYHRRALEIAESDGHGDCIAVALAGMGDAAEARGDRPEAIARYRQALDRADAGLQVDQLAAEWRAALDRLATVGDDGQVR